MEPNDYGTEEITLPDIPQANPSPEDLRRDAARPGAAEQDLDDERGAGEVYAAPWGAGETAAQWASRSA